MATATLTKEIVRNDEIGYEAPCSPEEYQEVLQWLKRCGTMASLGLLLRMSPECTDCLSATEFWHAGKDEALEESLSPRLKEVEEAWHDQVGPQGYWSHVAALPGIHACTLQGPTSKVRRFVNSCAAAGAKTPVNGFLFGSILCTAESAQKLRGFESGIRRLLTSFGQECFEFGRNGEEPEKIQSIIDSAVIQESIKDQVGDVLSSVGNFDGATDDHGDWFGGMSSEFDYLDKLNIGDPRRWGDNPGRGQFICVIDSGADESHPMLQQKVKHYVRFDSYGHEKEAYACMDQACHGSKIAAWACGNPLPLEDLELAGPPHVRLSIAPGARAVVVSAMCGDLKCEYATWPQLLHAIDWAAVNANHPVHGFQVVTISMEAGDASAEIQETIDKVFLLMKSKGLVPILAAGNCGDQSVPLGTEGYYIGALDADGEPVPQNGPRVDMLAPGMDLLCAHPMTRRLNDTWLGEYSGSSLSAAIVAGAVVVVAAALRISAREAIDLLLRTSLGRSNGGPGRLWLDGAFDV